MNTSNELKRIKVFVIKNEIRRNREQDEFFKELKKKKSMDDILTVNEIVEQYKICSKTVYRWKYKEQGFNQREHKGKITIKRSDLENLIKKKRYGRLL